ncbi:MAG: hypothetical protein C4K49_00880 [Candidatus Thorarchaeota archaeon]|nr:MAG: hypothetical protein C4K49_00880 [Candidatus Thorarchaeota archaeon]
MIFDILIPAFNESANLPRIEEQLIPQLQRDRVEFEVLVVDDGSTDDTGSKADELARRRKDVRVIHHERNMGLGAALRTGYSHASHQWVVSIDCDLSYSPDQVRRLVERVSPEVDAVFGSPYMRGGQVLGVGQMRVIPSKGVNVLYSLIMRRNLSCWTGMFRAVRTSAVQSIRITQDGFDGVAEIAVKLARKGFQIVEVPAVLGRRTAGESKAHLGREFRRHLVQLEKLIAREM